MTSKKHLKIMYGVAILFFLIAVISYAAFPVTTPQEPVRLMYATKAGKVLFDHRGHTAESGYALSCFDCHHHPYEDEMALVGCRQCHPVVHEDGVVPEYCLECHDDYEVEDAEYPKRSDAIHQQCMQCHEEFGRGPGSGAEDCAKCHVM